MALLHVKVVSGSSRDRVAGRYGDGVKVQVSAPPEGGKANKAVVSVIAAFFDIRPDQVQIVRGHSSPRKVLEVSGADQTLIDQRLKALVK